MESGQDQPIIVRMFGKFSKRSNADSGGRYPTTGSSMLIDALDTIFNIWQTTSGGRPRYRLVPFCENYSTTNNGRPFSVLYVYDEQELRVKRAASAQQFNLGKGTQLAHIFTRWPSTDGGVRRVQMVTDFKWLNRNKIRATTVDAAGNPVYTEADVAPGAVKQLVGNSGAPGAEATVGPGNAMTVGSGEVSSAARGTVQDVSEYMGRYATSIEVTTMGEPWFVTPSRVEGILFGLLIDELFNLDRVMPPFDGKDPASLVKALPFLGDPNGNLARAAAESGLFDRVSTGSWLSGLYSMKNAINTISGGSFVTKFTMFQWEESMEKAANEGVQGT
jgi:hypothetical protein